MKEAFILVDIQNDFCPGGALAVNEGDAVVPVVNKLLEKFDLIVATQDWHPVNHGSFAANHAGKNIGDFIDLNGLKQILWPVHCTQGSKGAELVKELHTGKIKKVFQKGTDKDVDSYSGFFDNDHRKATGLGDYLKENKIEKVYVAGLATDYCVKFTVMDALQLGFKVVVVEDAVRGVELNQGDVERALKEMKEAGAEIVSSNVILG